MTYISLAIWGTCLVKLPCLTTEKALGYIFVTDMRTNPWTLCYQLAFQRETWQSENLHMIGNYIMYTNVRMTTLVSSMSLKYTFHPWYYMYWAVDMGKWHIFKEACLSKFAILIEIGSKCFGIIHKIVVFWKLGGKYCDLCLDNSL